MLPKKNETPENDLPALPEEVNSAIDNKVDEAMKGVNIGELFTSIFHSVEEKGLGAFFKNPKEFIAETTKEVVKKETAKQLQNQLGTSTNSEHIKLEE